MLSDAFQEALLHDVHAAPGSPSNVRFKAQRLSALSGRVAAGGE